MAKFQYKSKNQNKKFLRAAEIIAGKISKIEGVVGIVAAGGIGRGHSDRFSDLDMIVYADSDKAAKIRKFIAVGGLSYKGIGFDIPVESFSRAQRARVPSVYWSQVRRWTLENSCLMYDTYGRVAGMLEQKLIFPNNERQRLMKTHREETDEILNYIFPTWEVRGQAYHLAGLLRRSIEQIVLWIYARNGKFQPYLNKWLFYHLENNSVPESRYFGIVKQAYTKSLSNLTQNREMRKILLHLCGNIGMNIEPVNIDELFEKMRRNWGGARDKTKCYLSF